MLFSNDEEMSIINFEQPTQKKTKMQRKCSIFHLKKSLWEWGEIKSNVQIIQKLTKSLEPLPMTTIFPRLTERHSIVSHQTEQKKKFFFKAMPCFYIIRKDTRYICETCAEKSLFLLCFQMNHIHSTIILKVKFDIPNHFLRGRGLFYFLN